MFKFFKELFDSAKEGVAEANAELAQEALATSNALLERQASALAAWSATSDFERFSVALAAPYRHVYSSELRDAKSESRKAYGLQSISLLSESEQEWKNLLKRDFSVTDGASAAAVTNDLEGAILEPELLDHDGSAVWLVRSSYVIFTSAALGYFTNRQAFDLIEPLAVTAARRFTGWQDFGESFLRGEKSVPGSNVFGRKVLSDAIKELLSNPLSPWVELTWFDHTLAPTSVAQNSAKQDLKIPKTDQRF